MRNKAGKDVAWRIAVAAMLWLSIAEAASGALTGERWQPVEIALASLRDYPHPHRSVTVHGEFTGPEDQRIVLRGYWDGGRVWRLRFAPPEEGVWRYRTVCSDTADAGLHGAEGFIEVLPYRGEDPFARNGWLRVSGNGRHLSYASGEPFFWLGDTAWEMTWKSRPDEVERYLDDRRSKGFNVIQAVVFSHHRIDEYGVRNRAGEPSFLNQDFSMLNPRYFDYLDWIVRSANQRGMAVALVPLWAYFSEPHYDPRVHRFQVTVDNAMLLARYLGARYAGYNVVWILGGDNTYDTPEQKTFWRDFAHEIRDAGGRMHLATLHPHGWRASFEFFDNRTGWIDFHMYQSSHTAGGDFTYKAAIRGYALTPVKPVLNGEAVYEDIYHNLWLPGDTTHVETFRIRPEHVRQANYESILSGALVGMTYGANGVWQWSTLDMPGGFDPRGTVDQALAFPGSSQMGVLKEIMVSHAWYRMTPASYVLRAVAPDNRYVPLAQNDDYLMAYVPMGTASITLNPDPTVERQRYAWINPATGETAMQAALDPEHKPLTLAPPDAMDWVLVVAHRLRYTPLDTSRVPLRVHLRQNAPNPFNPITVIQYELPAPSRVRLAVYNLQGQRVRTLVRAFQPAGIHATIWDGRNEAGHPAASGVYLYRLETEDQTETRKMTLIR